MKVIKVTNKYSEIENTIYDLNDLKYYEQTILDEVKTNLYSGYPISISIIEMSEKKFNEISEIN